MAHRVKFKNGQPHPKRCSCPCCHAVIGVKMTKEADDELIR